jgi:hypothetical protein
MAKRPNPFAAGGNMTSRSGAEHRAMRAAAAGKGKLGISKAEARKRLAGDSAIAKSVNRSKATKGKRPGQH